MRMARWMPPSMCRWSARHLMWARTAVSRARLPSGSTSPRSKHACRCTCAPPSFCAAARADSVQPEPPHVNGWLVVASAILGAEGEGATKVVGLRVAGAKRRNVPAALNCGQDRGRVVERVVDEMTLGERRDHDRRHAAAGAPDVGVLRVGRRSDVIPETTVLVVRDDDRRVAPVGAVADFIDERLE